MHAEQIGNEQRVDIAVAAAQQAAAVRAAESRAQAAMMVEAVEDRAYEVPVSPNLTTCGLASSGSLCACR